MKSKKIITKLMEMSLRNKIITGVIAFSIIGAGTVGVVKYNSSINAAKNNVSYQQSKTNETANKVVTEQTETKSDGTKVEQKKKADGSTVVTETKEDGTVTKIVKSSDGKITQEVKKSGESTFKKVDVTAAAKSDVETASKKLNNISQLQNQTANVITTTKPATETKPSTSTSTSTTKPVSETKPSTPTPAPSKPVETPKPSTPTPAPSKPVETPKPTYNVVTSVPFGSGNLPVASDLNMTQYNSITASGNCIGLFNQTLNYLCTDELDSRHPAVENYWNGKYVECSDGVYKVTCKVGGTIASKHDDPSDVKATLSYVSNSQSKHYVGYIVGKQSSVVRCVSKLVIDLTKIS